MKKFNRAIYILMIMNIYFLLPTVYTYKVEATSEEPSVLAHAYVVMDANSGSIIYSQDGNKKIYPASTVKMMTALVAVEQGNLSDKITVKESVLSNVSKDATTIGLKAGTTYTLEELLNMLLIYSASDAADTIADAIAGSVSQYIKLMNERAKSLGMNSTSFDNTMGLDIGNKYYNTYSTAKDIARLTKHVMNNKIIRNIVGKSSYTITKFNNGSSKTINNTNQLLRDKRYQNDSYKIIGTKTGTTNAAGYALSATAIDNKGREIICTFFGNGTISQMYENIDELLTYTYKNLSTNYEFKEVDNSINYGWKQIDNKWYYYDKSGKIKKGWISENGKWYYLTNTIIHGLDIDYHFIIYLCFIVILFIIDVYLLILVKKKYN